MNTNSAIKLRTGQPGGLALIKRHGRQHMKDISKLGGRPRALTIDDLGHSTASVAKSKNNVKEERDGKGKSLSVLLGLWKQKQSALEAN